MSSGTVTLFWSNQPCGVLNTTALYLVVRTAIVIELWKLLTVFGKGFSTWRNFTMWNQACRTNSSQSLVSDTGEISHTSYDIKVLLIFCVLVTGDGCMRRIICGFMLLWSLISEDHWWLGGADPLLCGWVSGAQRLRQCRDVSLLLLTLIQLPWLRICVTGAPVMVFSAVYPLAHGENHPSEVWSALENIPWWQMSF